MSKHFTVFKLVILHSCGQACDVLVTEEIGESAISAWKEYVNAPDGTESPDSRLLVIDGFYNSYDRAPQKVAVDLSETVGMSLLGMY